jgi:hypothetical protein
MYAQVWGYNMDTIWIQCEYNMDMVRVWYGYVFIQYGKQYGVEVLTHGL